MCVSGMPRTRIFIFGGDDGAGTESIRRGVESRVRPSPNSMETAWDILGGCGCVDDLRRVPKGRL